MAQVEVGPTTGIIFNPEELRTKYLEARDARLRPEGKRQYANITDAIFVDPYAEPGFEREAVAEDVDVLVLGGGFAGLLAAVRLQQAAVTNIRIVEKASDFGGVWYWNRYPGIRCDVESYVYLPLLEEVGTVPTEKYCSGPEILAHAQAIGRHYDLYDRALFQTQVVGVVWRESISRWVIRTDRDDEIRARFICLGTGPISLPKLPGIAGIGDFAGHSFHTSRWDFKYSGGDSQGNLTELADKRVAIIGTGATAVQVVPHVAQSGASTILFQRTPGAVDRRNNGPTDVEWFKNLRPGWQRQRMENLSSIMLGLQVSEDLVMDGWTSLWDRFAGWQRVRPEAEDDELMQLAEYEKMEEIRLLIETVVDDPAVAAALKPWYNLYCKRPLFSDDFLESFNLPNLTLVDTRGKGIDRITPAGIEFDGKSYDLDCIIYATGFDVHAPTYDVGAYELVGRNGLALSQKWSRGVRTLHGLYTHGFPNLFIVGSVKQSGSTFPSYTHFLDDQISHMAAVVSRCLADGILAMDVSEQAEIAWARAMADKAIDRTEYERECTPSWLNNEGKLDEGPSLFGLSYGGGPFEYVDILKEWRVTGFARDTDLKLE